MSEKKEAEKLKEYAESIGVIVGDKATAEQIKDLIVSKKKQLAGEAPEEAPEEPSQVDSQQEKKSDCGQYWQNM